MSSFSVRKVKKMKEGEERSSSGIKCGFEMSKAIEDALGRPGENYKNLATLTPKLAGSAIAYAGKWSL